MNEIISKEEFRERMEFINKSTDIEEKHRSADWLMVECLGALGYEEGIKIFLEMDKWYA